MKINLLYDFISLQGKRNDMNHSPEKKYGHFPQFLDRRQGHSAHGMKPTVLHLIGLSWITPLHN